MVRQRSFTDMPRTVTELKRIIKEHGNGRVKVLEWMDWVTRRIEENCPELIETGIAILSPQWFKVRECLFILKVDLAGWYEANKKLAHSVLGPAFSELGWLPETYVWAQEELKAAKETQHSLWERFKKEGITFYGQATE